MPRQSPGVSSPLLAVLVALFLLAGLAAPRFVTADEPWTIRSFDARYEIQDTGAVLVTEDILVDFGSLERHGIFRDIPVQYGFDSQYNRVTTISAVRVDDGSDPRPFELISMGPNLRIKIGDPGRLVSGEQRYRIRYTVGGGLNPFPDHDELYWNVTGNGWPVPIEVARATVTVPGDAIERIACYEGAVGSNLACRSSLENPAAATFAATSRLPAGAGLTIVVGLKKGAIQVPPLVLVPARSDPWAEVSGFLGLRPVPIALAAAMALTFLVVLARLWWVAGRDRWFGNMFYAVDDPPEETKPLFAQETVVVEYQPPEVADRRRLRPAEVGLLLDERADTLDVTASIIDLAVRGYLTIAEKESGGVLGLFKDRDYELAREKDADEKLLPYERRLLDALFKDGGTVKLSELKNRFYKDLAEVKEDLYRTAVKDLRLFPRDPEAVRGTYVVAGGVLAAGGAAAVWLLGSSVGAGVLGFPIAGAGVILFALAPSMPKRTALGRLLYRRCLGFRRYMVTAETARQEFAERAGIFHDYLPYAIVFGCVRRWARAFESVGREPGAPSWYAGAGPFAPGAFAERLNGFSSSLSTVIASTPGGRGGSGFGGSSGGGGGGGGGGSW